MLTWSPIGFLLMLGFSTALDKESYPDWNICYNLFFKDL